MTLKKIKELAEDFMNNAQILLERDSCIHPVLFTIDKEGVITPTMVKNTEKEDQSKLRSLMRELASVSDTIVLLMDANLKWVDKTATTKVNLENDPEAYTAILALVFTKKETIARQIIYVKDGNHYSYSYEPWMNSNPLRNSFGNPFKKE